MANIPIDQLAAAITKAISEYTENVSAAIEEKVDEVAADVLAATVQAARKRTGGYAKGFKITKKDFGGKTVRIIWNKKDYRRVHLLEFGHAKRGGGRVQAYPHLRPAYKQHATKLPDEIKRIIQNGG